jgi:hypothetical protein
LQIFKRLHFGNVPTKSAVLGYPTRGEPMVVYFGNAPATSVIVNSATSITATSSPGTGTVDVRVMTTSGALTANSAADQFTADVNGVRV